MKHGDGYSKEKKLYMTTDRTHSSMCVYIQSQLYDINNEHFATKMPHVYFLTNSQHLAILQLR